MKYPLGKNEKRGSEEAPKDLLKSLNGIVNESTS